MAKNFHERFQEGAIAPPSAQATGFVFTGVAIVVAILFRNSSIVLWSALLLAGLLAPISAWTPRLLEPLNRAWFKFALLLNRIVSPLVMLVLFAVAIVPFGLAMQLMRDPLRRRRKPGQATYWIARSTHDITNTSMRNQF